ncbi:virulence-associated protein E [Pseudomonas mandelii]|uniref:Virulence-associated protein E n=2 Tax=Pseudomonas mandelii TaxID=75612 RepID=A0AB36CY24_9PSED|nr:virulence-associated protein E [Pseudomonas mandelii]
MMPAHKLLSRLDNVREVKMGKWTACCPAHDDKDPSMNITEVEDGKLLVKCWAGCSVTEILASVELELRDLFPDCGSKPRRLGPSRAAIERERMVHLIGQSLIAQGAELSEEDRHRFELACDRLAGLELKA